MAPPEAAATQAAATQAPATQAPATQAAATQAPATQAAPTQAAPDAGPARVATPASDLLIQRVQVATGALANIEKEWPRYAGEDACILVFAETTEWLFGCPVAPSADFTPTGQTLRGAPVFSAASVTLGGPPVPYDRVANTLVGTVKPLVLKDSQTGADSTRPVFIIQELESLSKHHPAFDAQTTTDEWLAIFVHEYFHGYQLFHPKLQALLATWQRSESRDNLVPFYQENAAYHAAIEKEFDGLKAAVAQNPDPSAARAALRAWLTLYQARMEQYGPVLEAAKPGSSLSKVDGFTMFLEGVARYVEARFLVEETLRGPMDLKQDPRFKGFADFEGHPVTDLPGRSTLGREYFYPIGMYVSFLLDVARPTWRQGVLDDPRLLVGEVEAAVSGG